jgi:hypothetical protein
MLGLLLCLAKIVAVAGVGGSQEPPPQALQAVWDVQVTNPDLRRTGDGPSIEWQTAIGGRGEDTAYDMWPTGDGGWVVAGSTRNADDGDFDVAVVRLNADGEMVWARRYGGPGLDIAFGVRTLHDGTIVVAGWTSRIGAGEGDFLLLGLRPDGTLAYERAFGTAGEERATSLTVTREGDIAIIGESYGVSGDSRFYLVLADPDGNLLWERTYDDGPLNERGLAILELADGYLLAGNSMDTSSGSTATRSDGYVVRTDRDGRQIWARSYGGDAHDIVHHVAPLGVDSFLLTGYSRGFGASGPNDVWMVRIDGQGEPLEQSLRGGPGADHNIQVRPVGEGDLALVGYTTSRGTGGWDAEVSVVNGGLEERWSAAYGGAGADGAVAVVAGQLGGLVIAGYTETQGEPGRDILVYRLTPYDPS